jgi:hypothetical protein
MQRHGTISFSNACAVKFAVPGTGRDPANRT